MMHRVKKHLLSILCLACLSLPSLASGPGEKIFEAISTRLGPLFNTITSISLESDEIGIDNGIVANIIVGTSRVVTRNPYPTSKKDQFLVKDRIKLGYRLGAGFVLSGAVRYTREWTLVYPVHSHEAGILSRKFLVDLFLPVRVHQLNLPKNYSLMIEDQMEGQGRLKLKGYGAFPIGVSQSAGKVFMGRTFLSFRDGKELNAFKETGKYWRYFIDIYYSLGLIDLPIFESEVKNGRIYREKLTSQYKSIPKNEINQIVQQIVKKSSLRRLRKYSKADIIDSKFYQSYHYFTLLWLVNREEIFRSDYFIENNEGPKLQIENRLKQDWTTGFQTETYWAHIFLNKDSFENKEITNETQMDIMLRVHDTGAKESEFQKQYQPLIEDVLGIQRLVDFQSVDNEETELDLTIRIHYGENELKRILQLNENEFYKIIENFNNKKDGHYQRVAREGFHSRNRRRMRNSRTSLREVYMSKQMRGFLRLLNEAKERDNAKGALEYLVFGLRKLIYLSGGSFEPQLLKALNQWVGVKNLKSKANITLYRGQFREQYFVGDQTLELIPGPKSFLFLEPAEIYHFFK